MHFRYMPMEAAEIMLGYVNELRKEVHGDIYDPEEYELKLHPKLVELANIRAEEISKYFSHMGGTYTNANENIAGYPSIYAQFLVWKNSAGHYANMIDRDHIYFGYGYFATEESFASYGVQLFWYDYDPWAYYNNTFDESVLPKN